jgi:hypothetical protein
VQGFSIGGKLYTGYTKKESRMNQQAQLGTNRTGISSAPERAKEMQTGMEAFPPTSQEGVQDMEQVRLAYAKEAGPLVLLCQLGLPAVSFTKKGVSV